MLVSNHHVRGKMLTEIDDDGDDECVITAVCCLHVIFSCDSAVASLSPYYTLL